MTRNSLCLTALILLGAASATVRGAVILADAKITGASLGRGVYAYTLTLENSAASTSHIGLFWFGWEAGEGDFLESSPTAIQTPAGWSAIVEGEPNAGFSVQFVTYTNSLPPGSSVTFTFNSADSPKILAGTTPYDPPFAMLTSQVYSAHAASGVREVFVTKIVPADLGTIEAQASGPNLVLTWTGATNVVLQQTSTMNLGSWNTVPGTLGLGTYTATNATGSNCAFYRLAMQ